MQNVPKSITRFFFIENMNGAKGSSGIGKKLQKYFCTDFIYNLHLGRLNIFFFVFGPLLVYSCVDGPFILNFI